MTSTQTLNDNDFDSPGYEFLRSYQNMSRLYTKLVSLNYQKDFCPSYKCPQIHRYYFSMPYKHQIEQQFLFTCLSAWLIKDKCQMNLELEPEEYQDIDQTIGIIIEALKLLLATEDQSSDSRNASTNVISFTPGRLKQGYGPEVIYTLSIFVDRALEMQSSSGSDLAKIQVYYHNRTGQAIDKQQNPVNNNSITIGQPFVGGGLTTRPLGSYKIDDKSLLLDGDDDDAKREDCANNSLFDMLIDEASWYQQVERVKPDLESVSLHEGSTTCENWQDYLEATRESHKIIENFIDQFKPLLTMISRRIDQHLQVIGSREKTIQLNLKDQLSKFLDIWRGYSTQLVKNETLMAQVTGKANLFETFSDQLMNIEKDIASRVRELNDGKKLKELETLTKNLNIETNDLNLRVGLLLTVYAKKHRKLINDGNLRK